MFLKVEFDADGNFDKLRVRLVHGGHVQSKEELLYESVTSPTAPIIFVLAVAAMASHESSEVASAHTSMPTILRYASL